MGNVNLCGKTLDPRGGEPRDATGVVALELRHTYSPTPEVSFHDDFLRPLRSFVEHVKCVVRNSMGAQVGRGKIR